MNRSAKLEKKEIKASMEYLRKLFIMPDSPDKFVEFGHELLEMIHDFFKKKGGIHSSITLPELSEIFNEISIPEDPNLIKDVLSEIKNKIIAHSVKVSNPYYIGHMISPVPYYMILLEMIIAALNQNQVKIETAKASSFVERELVAWFHRLVYNAPDKFYKRHMQNPKVALGNITSDGTLANLTALLVAREKAFPPDGEFQGVRISGINHALEHYGYKRAVIIVSTRGHYSIKKAANLLGLGEENVINIPVDRFNKINIRRMEKRIQDLQKEEKTKIISIVGIAGTTETGNIDNLYKLALISEKIGAHYHVDACWGGSALLDENYRNLLSGIERADSVSIDGHKLLYCPMTVGMVLFKSEKDLNLIKQSANYIIRRDSVDTGRFTIEGSRPFSCLKPWASLKIMGRKGYRLLFKSAKENTESFIKIIENKRDFEILNQPELFIVNYRYIPYEVKKQIQSWEEQKKSTKDREIKKAIERNIRKANHIINAINIKLHKELRKDDTTFVSRTKLESTKYRPQSIVVLRAVLINPLTTPEILNEIINTQNRIARMLWKEFKSAYQRIKDPVP